MRSPVPVKGPPATRGSVRSHSVGAAAPNPSSLSSPSTTTLARRIVACLDVRSNDTGDLVVTKGDQYDVREESSAAAAATTPAAKKAKTGDPGDSATSNVGNTGAVRNLGKPRDLAARYYNEGADEIVFLNITSFRSSPVGDMEVIESPLLKNYHVIFQITT